MARARIIEIRAAGAFVLLDNDEKAWLPGPELSPHYIFSKKLYLQDLCSVGQELEVVVYGRGFGEKHKLVSHVRFAHDPWNKVKTWKYGDAKEMIVHSVTSSRAYGMIEPGIEAFVELADITESAPFPRSWRHFKTISVGDVLAGVVNPAKIDQQNRLVKLNAAAYFKNLQSIPEFLPVRHKDLADTAEKSDTGDHTPHDWQIPASFEIHRILLVDDAQIFLDEMKAYFDDSGIKTEPFSRKGVALRFLARPDCPDFDLAILDVNLDGDEPHAGFEVARAVAQSQPHCRIIMTTGGDIEPEKVTPIAGDLSISGILLKPFGVEELNRAFYRAFTEKPGKMEEFFLQTRDRPEKPAAQPREKRSILSAVKYLKNQIQAETVVLFSIHPLSYDVRIEAFDGIQENRLREDISRLRFSPVKDVAIDKEIIFDSKISHTPRSAKHRWLAKALEYESCFGFPVDIDLERKYGLFAFHGNPDHFNDMDRFKVKATADRIAQVLEIQKLEETIRSERPFYLAGKTYGSMAHDLMNALNREFGLVQVLKLLEDKSLIEAAGIQAIKDQIEKVRDELNRARRIAETFRRMSRSQHEAETEVDVVKMIDRVTGVMKREIEALNTTIRVSGGDQAGQVQTRVGKIKETGLEQVFTNLLLNAGQQILRFSFVREKGYILVDWAVVQQDDRDWLQVLIHDSGPGIHTRDFEVIFDKGYTTKEDGCGMGLDICRDIVTQAGGRIRVLKSILFCGTTFEVLLPLTNREVQK